MKSNIKNILSFLIGWPLSFIALYFIINSFLPKLHDIRHLFVSINIPLLVLGIMCFFLYYLLRSIVWQLTLNALGYSLSYIECAYLWATSEFKRYIPGNVWSFIGRTVQFSNLGISKKHIAKSLLVEMQIVFLGFVLVSLFGLSFLLRYIFPVSAHIPNLYVVTTATVFLVTSLYIYHSYFLRFFPDRLKEGIGYFLPDLSPLLTFWLLFSGTVASFFFGLGYYFTISSIVFLDPRLIISLSGFFVFSLLVGFLSFITPTGLGVREGSITIGLSKLIPLSVAGFASIFGRIILISTEISFIALLYIMNNFAKKASVKLQSFIIKHSYEVILGLLILAFCLYFSITSVLRHDNFYTGRFDLGNMTQTVWNTKYGNIFQFTNPDGTNIVSRLAFHADFLLILLTPLYLLWEDPKVLLIAQSIVVGGGAMFVYLLTREVLERDGRLIALILSFSYLMNPSVQWSILYDFHAVTLGTTFLLAAFYFMYKKRYIVFVIFAILAGITKEHVWLPVGLMGIYIMMANSKWQIANGKHRKKSILFGFFVFLVSITIFYYLIWHAIPGAGNSNQHFALSYFNESNDNPSTLIKNIISTPQETINTLLKRSNYLTQIFGALGYLSLLAPWVILFPLADLTLNILSDKPQLHQLYYQYTAVITPFLYIAAIYGVTYIRKKAKAIPLFFICVYILLSSIIRGYLDGPLPWTKKPNIAMFAHQHPNRKYISDRLNQIPSYFSVSATNNLGAQLTHRMHLYTVPIGVNEADIVAFLIRINSPHDEKTLITHLRNDPRYQTIWEKEGFIVFKKL